jgi:hypothetical protein
MKTFLPLVLGALSFFSTTPAVVGVDGSLDCFRDRATFVAVIADISDDGVGYELTNGNFGPIQDLCFASTLPDFSRLFATKSFFNAPIGVWDVSNVMKPLDSTSR